MANYSSLWDGLYGSPYAALADLPSSIAINSGEFNGRIKRTIAKMTRDKGARPLARVMYALLGAGTGATAAETLASLQSQAGIANGQNDPLSQGGRRTVAPNTLINRVTTPADLTLVQQILTQQFGPTINAGYPVDKSGNGGGGKSGGASTGQYGF